MHHEVRIHHHRHLWVELRNLPEKAVYLQKGKHKAPKSPQEVPVFQLSQGSGIWIISGGTTMMCPGAPILRNIIVARENAQLLLRYKHHGIHHGRHSHHWPYWPWSHALRPSLITDPWQEKWHSNHLGHKQNLEAMHASWQAHSIHGWKFLRTKCWSSSCCQEPEEGLQQNLQKSNDQVSFHDGRPKKITPWLGCFPARASFSWCWEAASASISAHLLHGNMQIRVLNCFASPGCKSSLWEWAALHKLPGQPAEGWRILTWKWKPQEFLHQAVLCDIDPPKRRRISAPWNECRCGSWKNTSVRV